MTTTDKMPMLFLGHGSPMNAIRENEFTKGFREAAASIPLPSAVVSVSAHWETRGICVTAMEQPPTIHDFGGFPEELFNVNYPARGNPSLASEIKGLIKTADVEMDQSWGLDHGTWSVLKHIYPEANIPVIQISLNYLLDPKGHYETAKQLSALRQKGVLIIGSGNIVHNLGMADWRKIDIEHSYEWAEESNEKTKELILKGDHKTLLKFSSLGKAFEKAVPTPEHFLPLLYVLALKEENENVEIFNDRIMAGSLAMTSFKIS